MVGSVATTFGVRPGPTLRAIETSRRNLRLLAFGAPIERIAKRATRGSDIGSSDREHFPTSRPLELARRPGMASRRTVKRGANPQGRVPAPFPDTPQDPHNSPAVGIVGSRGTVGPGSELRLVSAYSSGSEGAARSDIPPRYYPIPLSGTRSRYTCTTNTRVGCLGCLGCPWVK